MSSEGFVDVLGAPSVHPEAWVAPGAHLIGDVRVHRGASVWFNCALRSDLARAEIEIGEDSNIQDGAVVHIDFDMPCRVGKRVTVGHGAVLHATLVGDDCLVGMGAVLLSGSKIGAGSIVAAGAVVPEGAEIPPGVIVAGVPAKVRRECTEKDAKRIDESWRVYTKLVALHRGS
jgi:carbonic anhydrase/acetyltransferase-like protein (isoleucine patch superfamily)